MKKSKETLLFSIIYNFVGFFVQKFFTFFYHVVISRVLDKEKYGIFSFAMNIGQYASLIADLGLSQTNKYYVAKTKGDKRIISTIFYLKIFLLLFSSSIILILSYLFLNQYWDYIFLSLIYFFFFDMIYFFVNVLSSLKLFKDVNKILSLFTFLRVTFSIAVVIITYSLFGLFFAMILSSLIFFIYLVYYFKDYLSLKYFNRSKIKEFFDFGKYSGIINFSNLVYSLVDNTILGIFLSPVFVGFYSIASRLYSVTSNILNTVISTVFPYVVDWINKGEINKIKKIHDYFVNYVLFFSIPLSVILFFKSYSIILIIFGNQYLGAAIILQFLSLIIIKAPFEFLYVNLVIAKGDIKYVAKITTITAFLNIPLDILFVYLFGYVGVAISTLLLEYVRIYLFYIYIKREFGLEINLHSLIKQFLSGFVFLIFVLITIPLSFPIDIIIPGVFYILYFHFFVMDLFKILKEIKNKLNIE